MIYLPPLRQSRISFISYKLGVCTPSSSSLSAATHYVAAPLHRGCYINSFHIPHQRLVGPALEAPKPAHSRVSFIYLALALSSSDPIPASQAGASLVWGHEKFEFEDYHGFQWRAWFNECGRAFKIKAAWGHPDIVRGPSHPPSIFEPLR